MCYSKSLSLSVSCLRLDSSETQTVRSGESLFLPCPNRHCFRDKENTSYVWLKNVSRTSSLEEIGTEEHMRVHYHRSVLYILQLSVEDTGCYITRQWVHTHITRVIQVTRVFRISCCLRGSTQHNLWRVCCRTNIIVCCLVSGSTQMAFVLSLQLTWWFMKSSARIIYILKCSVWREVWLKFTVHWVHINNRKFSSGIRYRMTFDGWCYYWYGFKTYR